MVARFKRARFNWPDVGSYILDEEYDKPTSVTKWLSDFIGRSGSPSNGDAPPSPPQTLPTRLEGDKIIPIRTIRVFQGIKGGPGTEAMKLIDLPIMKHGSVDVSS